MIVLIFIGFIGRNLIYKIVARIDAKNSVGPVRYSAILFL